MEGASRSRRSSSVCSVSAPVKMSKKPMEKIISAECPKVLVRDVIHTAAPVDWQRMYEQQVEEVKAQRETIAQQTSAIIELTNQINELRQLLQSQQQQDQQLKQQIQQLQQQLQQQVQLLKEQQQKDSPQQDQSQKKQQPQQQKQQPTSQLDMHLFTQFMQVVAAQGTISPQKLQQQKQAPQRRTIAQLVEEPNVAGSAEWNQKSTRSNAGWHTVPTAAEVRARSDAKKQQRQETKQQQQQHQQQQQRPTAQQKLPRCDVIKVTLAKEVPFEEGYRDIRNVLTTREDVMFGRKTATGEGRSFLLKVPREGNSVDLQKKVAASLGEKAEAVRVLQDHRAVVVKHLDPLDNATTVKRAIAGFLKVEEQTLSMTVSIRSMDSGLQVAVVRLPTCYANRLDGQRVTMDFTVNTFHLLENSSQPRCFRCHLTGHRERQCTVPVADTRRKNCWNCSGTGHNASECTKDAHCYVCNGNHRPGSRACKGASEPSSSQ
ncbi:golgin subfamily A member 6-like protein 7 [Anopheles darlingi]|uniref:golgin subfamily A member 6-like protein 7 n=1 Tax=Anopheles darlingi TaxID=43151 RepID=UPI0021002A75|nr:golgin subfamily A member 6-like protein 7 [Anopheles darlingi]